jgi:type II secretory pathway component HofQ
MGWLFRADKVENTKSELLIFITPRIIQLEQRRTI